MKKIASVAIGVLVSGALLFLALRHVSWWEVVRAVGNVRPAWLAAMILVYCADLVIRSLRWRILLSFAVEPGRRRVLWDVFRLETIGLAINNVAFLRLGELARAYLAGLTLSVPGLTSLATIVVERAFDTVALMTLFAAAAFFYPETVSPPLRRAAALIVLGLVVGLFAVGFLLRRTREGGAWETRLRGWPFAHRVLEQIALGASALESTSSLAQVLLLSFGLWLVDTGGYWAAGRAMELGGLLDYGHCLVILSTAAAASFLPTVPGAFGAFEQFIKTLLVHWGVAEATALGYAALTHVVSYLLVTLLGITFLYQAGHSLETLGAALRSRLQENK